MNNESLTSTKMKFCTAHIYQFQNSFIYPLETLQKINSKLDMIHKYPHHSLQGRSKTQLVISHEI